MKKLLIITGPTSVGKTALGIKLAQKFNGEIVSADSRQVYRYMDIGTGKDIKKFSIFNFQFSIDDYTIGYHLIDKIPIWLVDVCEPNQEFSVAHFVEFAIRVIGEIWERGKLPIIVGGTGFWIKALLDGVDSIGIPPDWQLREKLRNLEIKKLQEKLVGLNPERWQRMNQSDRNNPRRLVRAIEIIKNQKSKIKNQKYNSKLKIDKLLMIGLKTKNYQALYKRIDERVEKRVKQGAIREIRELLKKGYSWDLPAFSATGYRVWQDYFVCKRIADKGRTRLASAGRGRHLESKKSLKETIQRWQYDEHGLARRQLTYFRKDKRIKWFDIEKSSCQRKIAKLVDQWYSKVSN